MAEPAYRVVEADGRYEVRQDDDRVIMTCADKGSAAHYANLLTRAYERGVRDAGRARREDD